MKKKPVPEKPATPVAAAPAPAAAAAAAAVAPVSAPEPEQPSTPEKLPESSEQSHVPVSPTGTAGSGGPPQTRRAVEYDALSRVDTNERNAADQEFSKFDQGPLVEQPAFVPADTPETPTAPAHSELPHTPTNGHGEDSHQKSQDKPQEKTEYNTTQTEAIAAEEDRWAQIRKNAAERQAAETGRASEEPETRVSQSERSDEGDTSGEESKSYPKLYSMRNLIY